MRKITLFLTLAAACWSLAGCEDHVAKITETPEVNEWVYSVMRANYLWSDRLPAKEQSGLTTPTQTYFDANLRYRVDKSVKYSKDTYGDRFSMIAETDATGSATGAMAATEMDFDFGFLPVFVTDEDDDVVYMQALYVIPGSPADKAGLKRGDAFAENIGSLGAKALLARSEITLEILNRETSPITIRKASFYNNPVLYSRIITVPANQSQKVGYLFYTHFTDGDDAAGYAKKLKETFKGFKDAGVTKLILDLRYNGGGEVENARLLASLIVESANLGGTWMYAERNTHKGDKSKFERAGFMSASQVGGTKAEIDELFVITSEYTASASELIIHTLKPYYGNRLHVIGLTTVGKNLGTREFTSKTVSWVINPITMRVYNKEKVSGYEEGLQPDVEMQEYHRIAGDRYFSMFPLGDIDKEWLLNKVMSTYFGVDPAVVPVYGDKFRSAGQSLRAKAGVRERGLTEAPAGSETE